jgi:hypothetical protein
MQAALELSAVQVPANHHHPRAQPKPPTAVAVDNTAVGTAVGVPPLVGSGDVEGAVHNLERDGTVLA